jgi:hypothetical protein
MPDFREFSSETLFFIEPLHYKWAEHLGASSGKSLVVKFIVVGNKLAEL